MKGARKRALLFAAERRAGGRYGVTSVFGYCTLIL
jgi:hypothetical protein